MFLSARRRLPGWYQLLVACLAAQLTLSGCNLGNLINEAERAARDTLIKATDQVDQSVATLESTIERQRVGLAGDMQTLLTAVLTNVQGLANQARQSVDAVLTTGKGLEQSLTADLVHSLQSIKTLSDDLTRAIQSGVEATIRQAAHEFDRQRTITIQQLEGATNALVRPMLAQFTRVGDRLVAQADSIVTRTVLRIVGGLVLLASVIALVVALVRKSRAGSIGMGIVAIVGLLLLVLAAPLSRIGQSPISIPAPEVLCGEMIKLGQRLEPFEKALTRSAAITEAAARAVAAPSPVSLRALRLVGKLPPPERSGEPEGREAIAAALLSASNQCIAWSPTGEMAALAHQHFTRALAQLSGTVFCNSAADCSVINKACDAFTQVCLDWGVYCDEHRDCATQRACDFTHHRCVAPELPCNSPAGCSTGYACDAQLHQCVVNKVGDPCEVTSAPPNSPCRTGVRQLNAAGWITCAQSVSATPEVCDGIDNDCNGSADDGYSRTGPCNEGVGACRDGTWSCVNGAERCQLAAAQPEICDGRDNDCNGTADDVPARPCRAAAQGLCANGQQQCGACIAAAPTGEACDGQDNDCNGVIDDFGSCGITEFMAQGPDDRNHELTRRPRLPTDLINEDGVAGPARCPEDEHGRVYVRQGASASAESVNGATCSVTGWTTTDPRDCRVNVHFQTQRLGSNVWCTVRWVGGATGRWLR